MNKNKIQKPRYSRVSDVIELLMWMLEKPQGVTLTEIQIRFNVCRRTAERLRDCLLAVLPQVDEIEQPFPTREKYWGFVDFKMPNLITTP